METVWLDDHYNPLEDADIINSSLATTISELCSSFSLPHKVIVKSSDIDWFFLWLQKSDGSHDQELVEQPAFSREDFETFSQGAQSKAQVRLNQFLSNIQKAYGE